MTDRESVARDVIAEGSAQTRAAVAGVPPEVIDGDRIRADYILRALDDAGLCIVPTSAITPARGPMTEREVVAREVAR